MTPVLPGERLRVFLVTDAWTPQVNGVVRTLEMLGRDLEALGHVVAYATPEDRLTLPMPTYPEIRLSLFPRRVLEKQIRAFAPNAVHIATEGPLGMAARALCLKYGIAFTTSFHTKFPESLVWRWLRWFHAPAIAMMVATQTLKREVEAQGFTNARIWSRGVDVENFRPLRGAELPYPKPIWLSVGRIAVEKNIEAFLALDLPGTKLLIGDGPARAALQARYPKAVFLGALSGEELVRHYAGSTVFVFPSRTDTFGLVLLEALACGLPVAAYPVQGPLDVIGDAPVGVLDKDLGAACQGALALTRQPASLTPRAFALARSWRACTTQFIGNLAVEMDT
jgi:glycosyltransferase involved in cell wall biosynthesis